VRIWVDQTVSSDLWLRPARGLSNAPTATFPPELSDAVSHIEFVAAFDRFRGRDMVYGDSIIAVGSGDFAVAMSRGSLPMITPRAPATALQQAMREGGVIISESLALKHKLHRGDRLTLPTSEGVRHFPICGIYRDYSNDRGVAVMDRALYTRLFRDDRINTMAIYLRPGITPDQARVELERRLGGRFHLFAFTNASIRGEVMKIFDQTFTITYALLIVSLIVAVLGIVNTMSALILERRRELALLRVLGMSTGQIRLMIVLESAIIGAAATLLGAATGYVLSYILIFVINKQSFGWTIDFAPPVALVALSLLATFVTTVITGIFPARLANQLELSRELKGE
jgi:putative ABC transport system permease protein